MFSSYHTFCTHKLLYFCGASLCPAKSLYFSNSYKNKWPRRYKWKTLSGASSKKALPSTFSELEVYTFEPFKVFPLLLWNPDIIAQHQQLGCDWKTILQMETTVSDGRLKGRIGHNGISMESHTNQSWTDSLQTLYFVRKKRKCLPCLRHFHLCPH